VELVDELIVFAREHIVQKLKLTVQLSGGQCF
jgi:hypothetical protein